MPLPGFSTSPLARLLRIVAIVFVVATVAAVGAPAHAGARSALAKADTGAPKRPRLPDTVDARDWRAYFRCAMQAERKEEERACLYWAERLDPEAPETAYLRYLLSDTKDTASATRARTIDPFFFQTRIVVVQAKAGIWTAAARRGWIKLEAADYYGASEMFGRYLALMPGDVDARWGAALAYHYRGRDDSAAMQLSAMIDTIRQARTQHTASYLSLDFLEFARATALRRARDTAGARTALQEALTENFASPLARMMLADLESLAGDTTQALAHWATVLELAGDDLLVRVRHARFLARLRRYADAERELQALVALEPHWVDLRRDLAAAIDSSGPARRSDAIAAWQAYLERAPRLPVPPREAAERRLALLKGERPPPAPRRVPDTP